jgi:hypothetical protein
MALMYHTLLCFNCTYPGRLAGSPVTPDRGTQGHAGSRAGHPENRSGRMFYPVTGHMFFGDPENRKPLRLPVTTRSLCF